MNRRTILAIDSSTSVLRLGLRYGDDRLVQSREAVEQSHGQILLGRIDALMKSAGVTIPDLGAIAVATGPGSFTGLRIGLAVVKGIAVALDIPVIAVSVAEIAALRLRGIDRKVHLLVPLNREECIRTVIETDGSFAAGTVENYAAVAGSIGVEAAGAFGFDLTEKFPGLTGGDVSDRLDHEAADLIRIADEKLDSGAAGADIASLEPLYIQKSQAEINFERLHRR